MKNKTIFLLSISFYFIIFSLYSQIPNNVPTNGLIGYWNFIGNANDIGNNNLNGVVNGATLTIDRNGNSNSAYSFSSSSNNISVPNNSLLSLNNTDFTINAWIKLDNFPALSTSSEVYNQYYTILGKRQFSANNDYSIGISSPSSPNGAGNLVFAQGPGGAGSFVSSNSPIVTGVWNNISIVYSLSNQTIKLYVNNILVSQQTGVTIPGQNSANFWFGNDVSGSATYFPGTIDDVGIWNRALTTTELNSIFQPCTETIATPIITTSGPTILNQGESVVLTSSYSTGNLWCNGATTQSITVSETGSYTVSVISGNCSSISQPQNVTLNTVNYLPLIQDFEVSSTYNSVVGFEGATATISTLNENCSANGNVLVGIQNANGNPWQGIEFKLSNTKAKLTSNKIMKVDVYCSQAINLLGKVEPGDIGNGPISANGQAYTTPGQWQTLTFDFAVPMDNTSIANGEYQKIIFFGNWNSTNNGWNNPPNAFNFYIDNIRVEHDCLNPDAYTPPVVSTSGPLEFCQGESVVLTSSYPIGNLWSNGATTQSITVTQSGSYTVSVLNNNCTFTSQPIVVSVLQLPNNLEVVSSGPTTICEGQSVSLSLNSLSAVRYLKFESYFSSDAGQVNVNEIQAFSNGVNVALNKPGFANSYEYGDWSSNGSNAVDGNTSSRWSSNRNDPGPDLNDPHYIVIDLQSQFNLESILLNISSFEQTFSFKVSQDNVNWIEVGNGNSVSGSFTFTPPVTNFSSYLWSNGATTPSISVSESGSYSVTAYLESTCSVVSNIVNVVVNPIPVTPTISISGPVNLCQGESVVLTSSYPNGNVWSNGETTQSITVSQSGSYTVSVSNNTCSSTSQPVVVTVAQVPSSINIVPSGPTTICAGSAVTLSLNSLSAVRYLKYECFYNPGGQARVGEIQVFSNGVNVALNKPGYASSYSGTGTWQTNGKNAVDGLSSTRWISNSNSIPTNTNPQFIVIDLETPQENINSILLDIGFATQTFSFKVSQDGINWTEIGSGESVTGTFTYTIPQNTINYSGYLWSNGATTPSITVTESGNYSVTAYIGSTCSITSNTVNVVVNPIPETPTISASGPVNICQGESVVLTSSYPTGNTWSNGATTQSITVTQSGTYSVVNGGCSEPSQPIEVIVSPQSTSLIPPNDITINTSANQCFASNINLGNPIGESCTNFDITNNAPSEFPIGLTVVTWTLINENGTTITANQNVIVEFSYDLASICYVTSDENQPERNRIFINNANNENVLEYQILREVSLNQYNVIGTIPPNQNSFLDETSNNLSLSRKYRVNTISICNSNSIDTNTHGTILLSSNVSVNGSVNLIWNPYLGISYGSYNIYRRIGNGSFELIETISSSNLSYNDVTANVSTNSYQYYVGIDVTGCNTSPQGRNFTTSLSQIKSNILNTSNLDIPTNTLDNKILIYPNPSSSLLNISIPNSLKYEKSEIYNLLGQKILQSNDLFIKIEDFENATYIIKIYTLEGIVSKRFVKE
jgi:hypothetical protein